MTDLLSAPSISPRLQWHAAHNLFTRLDRLPHAFFPCDQDKPWICANKAMTNVACGNTESEAELAYSVRYGIEYWALTEWNKAMGAEELCLD